MKTTGVVMLSIFLVFVLSANQLLVDALEAVRDNEGEELKVGVAYHIVPAMRGFGGGLRTGMTRNGSICPQDMVQEPFETERGLPATFFSVGHKNDVVQLQTDHNIQVPGPLFCRTPVVMWELDAFDKKLGRYFVTTRGVDREEKPVPTNYRNWFRIHKIEKISDVVNAYKFVFCHSKCDSCKVQCRELGILDDSNGIRRLCLREDIADKIDQALMVVFVKARTSTT